MPSSGVLLIEVFVRIVVAGLVWLEYLVLTVCIMTLQCCSEYIATKEHAVTL